MKKLSEIAYSLAASPDSVPSDRSVRVLARAFEGIFACCAVYAAYRTGSHIIDPNSMLHVEVLNDSLTNRIVASEMNRSLTSMYIASDIGGLAIATGGVGLSHEWQKQASERIKANAVNEV